MAGTTYATSTIKLLRNDYPALASLITPLISWAIYLIVLFLKLSFERDINDILLFLSTLSTLVGIPYAIRRLHMLRKILQEGVEVIGKITQIWPAGDSKRVAFEYRYLEQDYQHISLVSDIQNRANLCVGAQIALLLDPHRPQQALIRDLYR